MESTKWTCFEDWKDFRAIDFTREFWTQIMGWDLLLHLGEKGLEIEIYRYGVSTLNSVQDVQH
jgi:hypothetical protein